jgi:hypothetical protein
MTAAAAPAAVPRPTPGPGQTPSLLTGLPAAALGGPCLRSGRAFLRAHIRGSVRIDLDLHGPALTCEGGPRLAGTGLRIGFAGRTGAAGRIRMIFGIDGAREGRSGRELPTNLTVILEDEKLLFATQGDGNCTVDRLTQEPVRTGRSPARSRGAPDRGQRPAAGGQERPPQTRAYRIVAHGFCIAPVNDVSGRRRIVVTTFDFAGRADFAAR